MAQIREPPSRQAERIERSDLEEGGFAPPARRSSAGRTAALALMLVAIALVAAGVGFLLAGGRLPSSGPSPAPTAAVTKAPEVAPTSTQPAPTAPPAPTAVPWLAAAPAPTAPPPPTTAPTVAPTTPPQPTAPPPTPVPPTPVPKPTDPPPPTAPPKPAVAPPAPVAAVAPPAPAAAEKPASAPSAPPPGVHSPIRPGMDPRMAQIEGRVNEYFAALRDQDYARAQQACCTEAWRARYPVDSWQRNFAGVTDLRLVGPPRYLQVQDDLIVVDTDYTFVSGGVRRNFTLRWTFKPVGSEWQADLAEAFPTQSAPVPRSQPTPTTLQDGGAVSAPVPQPPGPSARPVLSAHAIAHRMVAAGDSITLTYEVTNPGSTPVTAILGASIRPIGGGPWINDPANDKRLTFPPGKSSHTRVFRVPIGTPAGRYDVAWGLFGDGRQGWGPAVESGILTINQ